MAKSLDYYYNLILWINYAIYLFYLLLKYFVAPALWIVLELASKENANSCLTTVAKITKPMRWLILQLFGGPLGMVERKEDAYEADEEDDNDIPTLYIRNKKLSYGAIMVLSMLIVAFGVLTLSSAVNLSLLRITHICSEDPNIDCYPQLIDGSNDTVTNLLNITINTNEPILDCTFWNSEGVSSQITFTCFQFVYNVEAFLAAMGGLLTIFMIVMKITTGIFLWLNGCCECCVGCCLKGKHTTRAILSVIASVVEVALAVVCLVLGASGILADDDTSNSVILRFIAMHAVEALMVFGVVATLLWLPWEEYVQD